MFEHAKKPLASREKFFKRLLRFAFYSVFVLSFSLGIGMAGYHYIAHLSWVDSLLNASMILTGMGPVNPMNDSAAKVFASFYALFSGVAFLTFTAVMFAPIAHRFLHKLSVDLDDKD